MCTFFPPEGPLSSQIRDSARKNVCKMPEIMHSTCCVNSILPFRLRMSLRNSLHLSDFLQEIGIRHSPDMQSSHASSIRTSNLPIGLFIKTHPVSIIFFSNLHRLYVQYNNLLNFLYKLRINFLLKQCSFITFTLIYS